jgi:hypothetical protein
MLSLRINIILFVLSITALPCFAQGKAVFAFEKEIFKFGKVKAGEILEFSYPFTNSGSSPLIISDIKVTCGCTKPEYPQEPILPGESAVIKVKFNTKGKIGFQDRTLEIISNADPSPKIVRFKGTVSEEK